MLLFISGCFVGAVSVVAIDIVAEILILWREERHAQVND